MIATFLNLYLLNKYKYKKIAIIDFDVHHGNGTQDIFYDNENVLFISTHQYPFYPGTGSEKEKGKFNNICNIPLPAGINSEEYLNAFNFALQRLKEFKPEFVLIRMVTRRTYITKSIFKFFILYTIYSCNH